MNLDDWGATLAFWVFFVRYPRESCFFFGGGGGGGAQWSWWSAASSAFKVSETIIGNYMCMLPGGMGL